MKTAINSQDEIIGAIENMILYGTQVLNKDEQEVFQDIAEAYDQYIGEDGLQCATHIQDEVSFLMRSVKGANAVDRVGDALAEIGGQY